MRNATYYGDAPETLEPGVGALFVDLDETALMGTVAHLSDEELAATELNPAVVAKIREALALGIPVVMCTRNDDLLIDRFFRAHPEVRTLFTDTIPCPSSQKSTLIKAWLQAHGIPEDQAAFLDDNAGERADVANNVEGSQVTDPAETHRVVLKRVERTRTDVVDLFLRRRRMVHLGERPFAMESDEIPLAA